MCDFSEGIKLCCCDKESIRYREASTYVRKKGKLIEQKNPENDKIPLEYIWTLFKYEGEKEVTEIGRYLMPKNDLGQGLNAQWVALNLNCTNCFDFDYNPQEGDSLQIHKNIKFDTYLSFVYRNGEWIVDHHDPWSTDISELNQGKVKPIDK